MQGNEQHCITEYLADIYETEIVICDNRVTTPLKEEIPQILKTYHDLPLSGHRGIIETTRKIRENYFWKGMTDEIKNYVESCLTFQKNKIQRRNFKAPMTITSQATEPFERVSMDLVTYSDISTNSNRYILTLQDELTRFVQAYAIPDKEAITISKQLLIFCQHYGTPQRLHSDQGSEFTSNILKQLMKLLGTNHTFSTAYHPQTNGALERFHATLHEYLRMYQTRNLFNWDQMIPFAVICHNTSINQSTGYTPHELLFGYKPYQFYSLKSKIDYTTDDYIRDLNEHLKLAREIAKYNARNMKEKAKIRYDEQIQNISHYKLGDKVMLKTPNPTNLENIEDRLAEFNLYLGENHRVKRELIDGLSSVSKWLIGTPDAKDARYYESCIEKLEKQEVDLTSLMQKQIQITSSTNNHF
ncbi:Retrovirus-related Pol polyprotein from transposon 412 [Eumeta japonica]|uniref:RNA-directed DNA polymerase n=1 Tax=Eumeta variegata TaxID=151549 RepID=A0A4C1XCW1_EUMVA|nr:Retrovirus-related Pol polyprotein from transposon 412 [Eumeta japonica]